MNTRHAGGTGAFQCVVSRIDQVDLLSLFLIYKSKVYIDLHHGLNVDKCVVFPPPIVHLADIHASFGTPEEVNCGGPFLTKLCGLHTVSVD